MRSATVEKLGRLLTCLPRHRRGALLLGATTMLLSSALEGFSAAAVLPLLIALMGGSGSGLGLVAAISLFCSLVLAGGALRWLSLLINGRIAAALGSDLAERALAGVFALPYRQQRDLSVSQVVAALAPQMRQLIQFILLPMLQMVSAAVLLVGLVVVMLALAWQVVWPTLAVMVVVYGLLSWQVRPRLATNGRRVLEAQQQAIRLVQQSMSGLRELRLQGMEPARLRRFALLDRPMRRREADNTALAGLPRFVLEPLAMVAIALVGGSLLQAGLAPETLLPRLGVLAYGAQRLLPLGQQLWASWSSIVAGAPLLDPLLPLLEPGRSAVTSRREGETPLAWQHSVAMGGVHFAFAPDQPPILHGFDLEIRRGEWVGLSGASGSGKSTTLDLLMGLLPMDAGRLTVDGTVMVPGSPAWRAWQRGVAYTGSRPPLLAPVLREAVLVDQEHGRGRLLEVLDLTGLRAMAERPLGEQGQNLSAGQLQRLGLARALLCEPSLLILDEATNALDLEAEAAVLGRLRERRPALTVVMVSHRQETLSLCDRQVHLR